MLKERGEALNGHVAVPNQLYDDTLTFWKNNLASIVENWLTIYIDIIYSTKISYQEDRN